MGSRGRTSRLGCRSRGGVCKLWWGTSGLGHRARGRTGGLSWGWCWCWCWYCSWRWDRGPGHASPAFQKASIIVTKHQSSQGISGGAPQGPSPPLLAFPLLSPLLSLLGSLLSPPTLLLPFSLTLLCCHRFPRLRSLQRYTGAISESAPQGLEQGGFESCLGVV